jgi:hypothetical protein
MNEQQRKDIQAMSPEEAAQMLRILERNEIGDVTTRLLLAQRGQESANPGESESMRKYEVTIRAGRRVRYANFPTNFVTEPVDPELAQAVEDIYEEHP